MEAKVEPVEKSEKASFDSSKLTGVCVVVGQRTKSLLLLNPDLTLLHIVVDDEKELVQKALEHVQKPPLMSIAPPLHPIADNELIWMYHSELDELKLAWDPTMANMNTGFESKRLMAKAFKGSLTLQQQAQLQVSVGSDQI